MTQAPQHTPRRFTDSYRGFAGLPPLVGLHTMDEAAATGLTVGESVARLKRIHWSLKRLHGIFVAHITSTAIYELKMAFSLHAHYCAEHVEEFANRDYQHGFFSDIEKSGQKVAVGGSVDGSKGYFVQPTIIDQPKEDSKVVVEEPFGGYPQLLS